MSSSHGHTVSAGKAYARVAGTIDTDLTAAIAAHEAKYHAPSIYTFADEFDSLSTAWKALYGIGDSGYGLDSDFLGSMAQVSVANSVLTITAERKATPSGKPYASGCIAPTFSQRYGIFEARIRYPSGQGVWPAFWLLNGPPNGSLPEIDVFEAYPAGTTSHPLDELVQTLHTTLNPSRYKVVDVAGLANNWHVHRIDWRAGYLAFSLDGVEMYRLTSDIPAVPMYPILTLALGADQYRVDATTPATLRMDFDYLRVQA